MSFQKDDSVATTVVLSLDALISYFQSKLPGVSFVHDDSLGYESGTLELRGSNTTRDGFKNRLPVFLFKRSILRPAEEAQGRRSVVSRVLTPQIGEIPPHLYRNIFGTYDVQFMFISSKIAEMENFEISWLTESGFSQQKNIELVLPQNVGTLSYNIKYNNLEDKIVNNNGNYYKALVGSMSVTGFQLAFHSGASIIEEINARILTFSNVTLSHDVITPQGITHV